MAANPELGAARRADGSWRQVAELPRVVLDAVREGVMVHGTDGTVVFVNRAAARLVGADESDIEGRTPYDERWQLVLPDGHPLHPDGHPSLLTLRTGRNVDDVLLGLRHEVTGRLRWAFVTTRGIGHSADGLPGAVVVSIEDVTDRRAAEEGLRRSEEQFRLLAEYAVDLITTHGPEGVFRYVSPAARAMLGYEPDELVGRTPHEFVHPDDAPILRDVGRRLAVAGTALATLRVRRADRRYVWLEVVGHAILGSDGRVAETHSVARDVTARREAEDRLRASEERYRALVDNLPDAIWRFDREGRYLYLSPAAQKITGASAESVLGRTPDELGQPRDVCDLLAQHRVRVLENGEPVEFELGLVGPGGDVRHLLTRMAPEFGGDGRVARVVTVSRDITSRKRAEEELAHRAMHDVLTGLPNRSLLLAHLEHVIAGLNRTPGLVAVLFLDLDRFKLVNDSLGHPAGDHLLVQVARRLAGLVRSDDLVARLGGDEFALALRLPPGAVADAVHIADRVHALLRDPFLLHEQEVRVATSIGIATTEIGTTRAASLLRDADAAMYRGKARGRGCTEVFDARLRAEVLARLRLENDLRQAVDAGALDVRYQPEVDLVSGLVVGVEALVRWPHPEHGLLLPAAFVSLAEETGLAPDLGRFVLQHACADAAAWLARWPHRRLTIRVNVSARQLAGARLAQDVADALAAAGLPPDRLCLEITEAAMLADEQASAATLGHLHALGVRTALDDFGMGYSSLSQLKNLRLHTLKLDGGFVRGLPDDPRDRAIVASVVALGTALDLEVIAEGVETEAQMGLLRGLGCRIGQGNLWSGPVPAAELATLLERPLWQTGTVDLTDSATGGRCG